MLNLGSTSPYIDVYVLTLSPRLGGARRWLQDTSKEKSPMILFFSHPPLLVSPGSPEVDPMIDQNRRSGEKKMGLIKTFSRVYPEKGEHATGK